MRARDEHALVPGLLRVVTEVRRNGAGLDLSTQDAPIQLALQKLHAKLERDVVDIAAGTAFRPNDVHPRTIGLRTVRPRDLGADAAVTIPLDFSLFDGDGDPSTSDDQIAIRGSLGGGIRLACRSTSTGVRSRMSRRQSASASRASRRSSLATLRNARSRRSFPR